MKWQSKLVHPEAVTPTAFQSLSFPTYRGSTVVFNSHENVREGWRGSLDGYSYGLYGTPTTVELAARIAALEGAHHCFVVPSGQAAISLIHLSFCAVGSHVLVPSTPYGPNAEFAAALLSRYGVTLEIYKASLGSKIRKLIRPETALIWCESPGSITMEVQDVPAIVDAAHEKNVIVALDNTYASVSCSTHLAMESTLVCKHSRNMPLVIVTSYWARSPSRTESCFFDSAIRFGYWAICLAR